MTRADHLDAILELKCKIVEMREDYPEHSLEYDALTIVLLSVDVAWYALAQDWRKCAARLHHMGIFVQANERRGQSRELN